MVGPYINYSNYNFVTKKEIHNELSYPQTNLISKKLIFSEELNEYLDPVLEDSRADGITNTFIKAIYKDDIKVKIEELLEALQKIITYN